MIHQAKNLQRLAHAKTQKNRAQSAITFLAICSGKGGVGKSTIAGNLGYALSQNGYKSVLLDADIGLANLDIILNVSPKKNILHLLKGQGALEEILLPIAENFDLIPSDSGEEILKYADSINLDYFLSQMTLLNDYHFMIVDTGAGIGKYVVPFVEASDRPIVVLTPEPTSITDAYAMIKSISKTHQKIDLIINQVKNGYEASLIFEKLSKVALEHIQPAVELSLLGHIRYDDNIYKSIRQRVLFYDKYPDTKGSEDILQIVKRLTHKMEHNLIDTDQNRTDSFFDKVFSTFRF